MPYLSCKISSGKDVIACLKNGKLNIIHYNFYTRMPDDILQNGYDIHLKFDTL